jgi:hypothetical protein
MILFFYIMLGKAGYPLFVICEGKGQDATYLTPVADEQDQRQQQQGDDLAGTEDFVFL